MYLNDGMPVVPLRYYRKDISTYHTSYHARLNLQLVLVDKDHPLKDESLRSIFESEKYCLLRGSKYRRHAKTPYREYFEKFIIKYASLNSKNNICFLKNALQIINRKYSMHSSTITSITNGIWIDEEFYPFYRSFFFNGKPYCYDNMNKSQKEVLRSIANQIDESIYLEFKGE